MLSQANKLRKIAILAWFDLIWRALADGGGGDDDEELWCAMIPDTLIIQEPVPNQTEKGKSISKSRIEQHLFAYEEPKLNLSQLSFA